MPRRLVLPVLIALLALAALPAAASAGVVPRAANPPIDGPSPDIDKLGGVDLARDGTGGLVYLKRVDGALARLPLALQRRRRSARPSASTTGSSRAPTDAVDRGRRRRPPGDRVDGGQHASTAASSPATTSSRGRCSARPRSTTADRRRSPAPRSTWASTAPPTRRTRRPGGGGGDVRVARLMDTTWSAVGAPLDIDPARAAGRGNQRSRVGVSAEGNAHRRLGRGHADGRARLRAPRDRADPVDASRRSSRCPTSAASPGGRADSPGHRHRGRRLVRVGGVPPGLRRRLARDRAADARLDLRPAGAARRRPRLDRPADRHERPRPGARDVREPGRRRDRQRPLQRHLRPRPAAPLRRLGDGTRAAAGRLRAPRERGRVAGRLAGRRRLDPRPDAAGADQALRSRGRALAARPRARCPRASSRSPPTGSPASSVAMAQGAADQPRASPSRCRTACRAGRARSPAARGRARGGRSSSGARAATCGARSASASSSAARWSARRPAPRSSRPQRLSAGRPITYQVIAIDARGQENASRTRKVRFDNVAPKFKVRIVGKRRAGRALRIVVKPSDGKGSGVARRARALRRLQARGQAAQALRRPPRLPQGHASRCGWRSTTSPATAGSRRSSSASREAARGPSRAGARRPAAADGHRQRVAGLVLGRRRSSRPARPRRAPASRPARGSSTSAASPRSAGARRSPPAEEIDRVVPRRRRARRATCSSPSTPTSRRSPRRRSRRAPG